MTSIVGIIEGEMPMKDLKSLYTLHRITDPHCYSKPGEIYGYNDMLQLMDDLSINTARWPDVKVGSTPIICASVLDSKKLKADAYERECKTMISQYVQHMIKTNQMQSYDDVVLKSQLINISKAIRNKDEGNKITNTDELCPRLGAEIIDQLRLHKWYAFIPCLPKITIQINRKRFIQIELFDISEKNREMTVKMSDYIGDKNDWIICNTASLKMKFEDDNRMSFDYFDCKTYEELMTQNVQDLKWTKKHIQFWYDAFGLNAIEKIAIIDMELQPDEDSDEQPKQAETIIFDLQALNQIKSSMKFIKFSTKATGHAVYEKIHQTFAANKIELYLKSIAIVNNALYTHAGNKLDHNDKQNREIWSFDDAIEMHLTAKPIAPEPGYIPQCSTKGGT